MARSFRSALGLVATAALLAGCAMSPQPSTITVPNPLAALNGVMTAPSGPIYGARTLPTVPASGVTYQAAPAYSTGYSVAAPAPAYVSGPSYTTTGSIQTVAAPTVIDSGAYTLPGVAPAYAPAPISTPDPVQYSAAPAPMQYSSVPAPVQYSSSLPVQTLPPVQAPALSTNIPTLGAVQPVQATGTTYDLTSQLPYGAPLTPAPAVTPVIASEPSMGGSFQVVAPTVPSLGNGVATYTTR